MEYLEAHQQLLARGPGRMIPDLERITQLAGLLGDPQTAYPSIHVTGTNGKTSVSRMVTTLLSAAGLSAGTYTSPHLQTPRERLSVAGRPISREQFAAVATELAPLVDVVDEACEHPADHVTYFEYLTAMAYWWFADLPVDVGVFEVGMGGRWDATNLVRGDVAVLTTIDVDHRELGTTPAEIAEEKVGIIKKGSNVVSGRQRPDVADRIRRAVDGAGANRLIVAGDDFDVVGRRVAVGGQTVSLRVAGRTIPDLFLPLYGEHQASNAAVALAALHAFSAEAVANMPDDLLREAFAAVAVPGRLEVVNREPTIVLDGAHNPNGAQTAAATLDESFGFRNLILVIACLADKDIPGIVGAYKDLVNHVVVTTVPSPRAAPVDEMSRVAAEIWAGTGVIVEAAPNVAEALEKAAGLAGEGDGVLVTGSLYTVGAARDLYVDPPTSEQIIGGDGRAFDPEGDDEFEIDEAAEEAAFREALDEMIASLGDDDPEDDSADRDTD